MTARHPPPARGGLLAGALVAVLVAHLMAGLLADGTLAGLGRLAVAVVVVAVVRRAGLDWIDLGLARETWGRGAREGLTAAAVLAIAITAVAALPPVQEGLRDASAPAGSVAVALDALVRIPLLVALPEELLFRSALLALLMAVTSPRVAVAASAVLFGAWHLPPPFGPAAATGDGAADLALVLVATTAAGAMFAWLRLRSGSVVASWCAHVAINVTGLLLTVRVGAA